MSVPQRAGLLPHAGDAEILEPGGHLLSGRATLLHHGLAVQERVLAVSDPGVQVPGEPLLFDGVFFRVHEVLVLKQTSRRAVASFHGVVPHPILPQNDIAWSRFCGDTGHLLGGLDQRGNLPANVVRRVFARIRSGAELGEVQAELTPREKEILAAFSQGMSYAAIAEAREVKPVTIRNAIYNIQVKLGLGTKQEIVVWAVRNGLLDD